jgi:hypothetical protein
LEEYFKRREGPDGKIRVRLQVPLHGLPALKGLALAHHVNVEAHRGRDEQNLNDVIDIAWDPGTGPFPKFAGTIATWADGERSVIEIDGGYEPPIGASGELFDETVGHAVAQRTIRELLKELAAAVAGRAIA